MNDQQQPFDITQPVRLDLGSIESLVMEKSFGLARPIPRIYHKASIILAADADGNFVPGQDSITVFVHGVNDNYGGAANPYSDAGISGLPAKGSVEFTNALRNGGFSMELHAILLTLSMQFERLRVVTPDDDNTTARVERAGGQVGYNEWALLNRMMPSLLGATELQLLPPNDQTSCNLYLGIPQIMSPGNGYDSLSGSGLGQPNPICRWSFRDDIVVNPGREGDVSQPNRITLFFRGLLDNVQKMADTVSRTVGTLLVFDIIFVADVAYGVLIDPKTGAFRFATVRDYEKWARLRECF